MKKTRLLAQIHELLRCPSCKYGDLAVNHKTYICDHCGDEFKIFENIPRFVKDESWFEINEEDRSLTEKTKNYFGFEWEYFESWGFIDDELLKPQELNKYEGGTIQHRKGAFSAKCRIEKQDISDGKIILDAGCGNGRYTYEAATRYPNCVVIGIDIGYGSVRSAAKNTEKLKNVIILQGDLLNLPFKPEVIDAVFSNGVLMHTGDARASFGEIASKVKPGGVFTAHIYGRLNIFWEINDRIIRSITSRMSIEWNLNFARGMAALGRTVDKLPLGLRLANQIFRLQTTEHHMFDWYSAPVASHHRYSELHEWFLDNNFDLVQEDSELLKDPKFIKLNHWIVNLKGRKK